MRDARLRELLVDLSVTLVGPEPGAPRPRRGSIHALAWAAAFAGVLVTMAMMGHSDWPAWWQLTFATGIAGPVGFLPTRPLLAWRLAWLSALVVSPTIPESGGLPWPGHPVQVVAFPLILLVVAASVRAGIVAWVLLLTAALVVTFARPQHLIGSLIMLVGIVVLGDQIRRRRAAAAQLEEEEERTELEKARRAVLQERGRIAREMHDVVAHHMSMIAVRAETAPYRLEGVPPAVATEFTGSPMRPGRR